MVEAKAGMTPETTVLIAGGGASGTIQALLLAQQGISSIVAEARAEPYDIPRAHAINPRSMEICRALGIDLERICQQAAPASEAGMVYFLPRLFGPVLGSLEYERQDPGALDHTPNPLVNIPQTEFEEILFEAAAREPLITTLRQHRWTGVTHEGDLLVSELETPTGLVRVASRYLIGCDGAGSAVRESLGIGMSGDHAVVSCLSIVFRADLREKLADRPGVLYWTTDPEASGTFLGYHMDRLWSFVEMHPPGAIDMSRYPPERCREIVLNAAGGDIPDLEIHRVSPWTMTSQVADSYGNGRILLVGDAAHRFPPTGGLGLNTGIQDAHNLAWKIAAVEAGWASEDLLASYEAERRPVAARNAAQSLLNAQRLQALAALRCNEADWREPDAFGAWLGEDDRKTDIAEAIALQAEHFDSFGLQLGFSYPPSTETIEQAGDYRPSAAPGHRMPHAWIAEGRSTLDLLSPTRFTLLTPDISQVPGHVGADPRIAVVDLSREAVPQAWLELSGLQTGDSLLVRPDGHVLYRGPAGKALDQLDAFLGRANTTAPISS